MSVKCSWKSGKFETAVLGERGETVHHTLNVPVQDSATGKALVVQTPRCSAPFHPGENPLYAKAGFPKLQYTINVVDPAFRSAIEGVDAMCLEWLRANATTVVADKKLLTAFAKNTSLVDTLWRDTIQESTAVKEDGTPRYPPAMRFSFRRGALVFDAKGEKIVVPYEEAKLTEVLPNQSEVIILAACEGIWSVSGKFGVAWRCVQVKTFGASQRFKYDIDDEGGEDAAPPTKKPREQERFGYPEDKEGAAPPTTE